MSQKIIAQVTFVQDGTGPVRAVTDFREDVKPTDMMRMLGQAASALYNVARDLGRTQRMTDLEVRQVVFPRGNRSGG